MKRTADAAVKNSLIHNLFLLKFLVIGALTALVLCCALLYSTGAEENAQSVSSGAPRLSQNPGATLRTPDVDRIASSLEARADEKDRKKTSYAQRLLQSVKDQVSDELTEALTSDSHQSAEKSYSAGAELPEAFDFNYEQNYSPSENTSVPVSYGQAADPDRVSDTHDKLTEQQTVRRHAMLSSSKVTTTSDKGEVSIAREKSIRDDFVLGGQQGVLPELADKDNDEDDYISPYKVQKPRGRYYINQGSHIRTTLVNGINSDLPGQVTALVSQNVFDSLTGDYLLIPQGTRAVGRYESSPAYGQNRVFVCFDRLIFPNGDSLKLGNMGTQDTDGYSGLGAEVDNHYLKIWNGALLIATLSTAADATTDSYGDYREKRSTGDDMARNVSTQMQGLMTENIRRQMNLSPTLTVEPGTEFSINLTKDLYFDKPYKG